MHIQNSCSTICSKTENPTTKLFKRKTRITIYSFIQIYNRKNLCLISMLFVKSDFKNSENILTFFLINCFLLLVNIMTLLKKNLEKHDNSVSDTLCNVNYNLKHGVSYSMLFRELFSSISYSYSDPWELRLHHVQIFGIFDFKKLNNLQCCTLLSRL